MNIRVAISNLRRIFTYKIILLIVLTFVLIFEFQLYLIRDFKPINLFEYIKYCFYGVDTIYENIRALFAWSIFQLIFIMIMINYLTHQFNGRNIYLISRLGNKYRWFFNIQLVITLSSFIFFFIGILTLIICSIVVNKNLVFTGNTIDILWILIVLSLNSCFYINLYLLMALKWNHSMSPILILVLLIFLFIDLGSKLHCDLYNPFTQCIMLKHYINNISFSGSIILLLICNSLIIRYLYHLIIKKDLINITR